MIKQNKTVCSNYQNHWVSYTKDLKQNIFQNSNLDYSIGNQNAKEFKK